MGFGLARPVPARSIHGEDEYLILGVDAGECLVVDQDGDMRLVFMSDLKTKMIYLRDPGVWLSTQLEVDDLEEPAEEPEAE